MSYKVRVLKAHRTAIVGPEGKPVRYDAVPNEDIVVPAIYQDDIKYGLYRPYRQLTDEVQQPVKRERQDALGVNAETQAEIERLEGIAQAATAQINKLKMPSIQSNSNLTQEPKSVTTETVTKSHIILPNQPKPTIITDPNQIPDSVFIEQGETVPEIYTQENLRNKSAIVNNLVNQSLELGPEQAAQLPNSVKKLPTFSEANGGIIEQRIQGEIVLDPQLPEPTDNKPVELKHDGEGKLDVIGTLGLKV